MSFSRTKYFGFLVVLILLLSQQANAGLLGKDRKQLLDRVQSFRDSVVMVSSYPTSIDELKQHISNYLTSAVYPFEVVSDNGYQAAFQRTYLSFTQIRNRDQSFQKGGASAYTQRCHLLTIFAKMNVTKEGVTVSFSEKTKGCNNHGGGRTQFPSPPKYEDVWSELTLRWKLYKDFYGDTLPALPSSLEREISDYNENQSSSSKKIIQGRDY